MWIFFLNKYIYIVSMKFITYLHIVRINLPAKTLRYYKWDKHKLQILKDMIC